MNSSLTRRRKSQRGVAMVEYALGAALLVIVFALIGKMLYAGGMHRAGSSQDAVSAEIPEVGPRPTPGGMVPCGEGLHDEDCI